jgi:hypothetical protein
MRRSAGRSRQAQAALLTGVVAALVGLLLSALSAFGASIEISGRRTGSVRVTLGNPRRFASTKASSTS